MRLARLFGTRCLVVHPVLPHRYALHSKGIKTEVYLAEEAIGLAKSAGWEVDYGVNFQSVEEEGEKDQWLDEELRESIALGSILRVRSANSTNFLGKGQLASVQRHLASSHIPLVFINSALSPLQLRNLEK